MAISSPGPTVAQLASAKAATPRAESRDLNWKKRSKSTTIALMDELSRCVTSSQAGPHDRLCEVVQRHQCTEFRRPIALHTQRAFDIALDRLQGAVRPLIIDAGCGNGDSTRYLATTNPDAWVIGIDRSAKRLSRHLESNVVARWADNYLFVRGKLEDWFALCALADLRFVECCFFYPNPYPKSAQLKRRWHAHPIFPTIVQLSQTITLRTNWQIYAEEFSLALRLFECQAAVRLLSEPAGLSPFERKYARSGHQLFEVKARLR